MSTSTLWMQSDFSPERAGEKEATGCIFQCFASPPTHTCTYLYVWCFDTAHNLWSAVRKELWAVNSHPSFRESAGEFTPWSRQAERSGLIKVGFPPMFQFLNHMWHHSLMPLQVACYRVILKITTLETVEERAMKGKYPSNWRAINGKPVGKMGIYNMTNLTTIELQKEIQLKHCGYMYCRWIKHCIRMH